MVIVAMVIHIAGMVVTFWGYIIGGIKWIKCRKKKKCKNDTCPIREYCNRIALSDRELFRLRELINEWEDKSVQI